MLNLRRAVLETVDEMFVVELEFQILKLSFEDFILS